MSALKKIYTIPIARQLVDLVLYKRAYSIVSPIQKHVSECRSVIDIGAGSCHITKALKDAGMEVTPVDVVDMSCVPGIHSQVYNGKNLPFADNSFDAAVLITVLHHTSNPVEILHEAQRVARNLVIVEEDIFDSQIRKYATFVFDSLVNWEWAGHPHSNNTDSQWKNIFQHLGATLLSVEYFSSHVFVQHARYYLKP